MISYENAWWTLRATMQEPVNERDEITILGLEFPAGGQKIYVPELVSIEYGYSGVTVALRLARTHRYNWSTVFESPTVEVRWRKWVNDGKWTRYPLSGELDWIGMNAFTAPYDQAYPPEWIRQLVDDSAPQRWLLHLQRRHQKGRI